MEITQIRGLHTCQPQNAPEVGQVKRFSVEQRQGKSGKPWTKISNDQEGQPYKITSVSATNFKDDRGNISFNLEIEPCSAEATQGAAAPQMPQSTNANAPRTSQMNKDDYWERKEDRDRERDARDVAKQPRIERQHSQHMALLLATLDNRVVMDEDEKFSTVKLCELISWFQRDLNRTVSVAPAETKEEPY